MTILAGGIEAAKSYADLGWQVVILHGVTATDCTCSKASKCGSAGKHPRGQNWQTRAMTDPNKIEIGFQKYPDSNLGVRLGPESGICDVEFDDAEGAATAERLLADIVTPTYTSHRSTHRIFRFPTNLEPQKTVEKIEGLEIRFGTSDKGAQSVFPPSVHASGKAYDWLPGLSPDDVEAAEFPPVLVDMLEGPQDAPYGGVVFEMGDDIESLATHPGESEGERNTILCKLVGRELAHGNDYSTVRREAAAWAKRCSPPLPTEEAEGIVDNLQRRERRTPRKEKQERPRTLHSRLYSQIEPREVEWFWPERVAIGKLSILVGDAGLGKTFLSLDLAARLSRGDEMPDGSLPPAGEAAILTCEDSEYDTIRPRLDAAGAEPSRVHHIDGVGPVGGKPRFLALNRHLEAMNVWLKAHPEVRYFIFDPISAFLGDGVDSHKNSDVRAVLGPLADMAEQHRVAVLGITHMSKGNAKALHRVIGSVAFVAAARAAWSVSKDPDDPDRRLFLPVKNNLGNIDGLAYRLTGSGKDTHIEWEDGPITMTADDAEAPGERSPIHEATEWLQARLDNGAVNAAVVLREAGKDGIAERTLKRAKADLGISSRREGSNWVWELPAPF